MVQKGFLQTSDGSPQPTDMESIHSQPDGIWYFLLNVVFISCHILCNK